MQPQTYEKKMFYLILTMLVGVVAGLIMIGKGKSLPHHGILFIETA